MLARFVSAPRFAPDARIAFRNGRFIDVEAGRCLPGEVTLVVEGDTITALDSADVEAEASWDLGGRTVLPGMVNSHVHTHMTLPALVSRLRDLSATRRLARAQIERNMADCLAVGITHLRDALADDLGAVSRLAARIASGELPGPRLLKSALVSQLGGSQAPRQTWFEKLTHRAVGFPYLPYDDPDAGAVVFAPDADEATVRAAVDRAIDERAADTIKLYDQRAKRLSYEPGATVMSQRQLDAAADQARLRGVPATMHHVSVESLRRGARAGVTSLAIAYDLCWRPLSGEWAEHPRLADLEALRERSHRQLVKDCWLPELREAALLGFERAGAGRTKLAGLLDLGPAFRYFSGLVSHGIDNARKLHEAGAIFGCGNDAGAVPRTPAMIGLELGMFTDLVGGGDDAARKAALRAATIDGARALGVADRFGSLAAGKVADLAVLDGDPLEDISVIGKPVAALFMNGELVIDNCGLRAGRRRSGFRPPEELGFGS